MSTFHEDCQQVFDQADKDSKSPYTICRLPNETDAEFRDRIKRKVELIKRFEDISNEVPIDEDEANQLLAELNIDDKAAYQRLLNLIENKDAKNQS